VTLRVRRVLLVALIALTAWNTFEVGRRLGMATHVATRHAFYSIPYSISRLYFNTRGYVILRDVAELFIATHPHITNGTLQRAQRLQPRRDRVMFFPADDKGDADFATLAFQIFGLDLESLYYMWFALAAVPIALFVVAYWHDAWLLAALSVLVLSIGVGLRALPLTTELFSIQNPRSFGVLSMVSVLHLCFAIVTRQKATPLNLICASLQALFIAFSIHVRSTEIWQVLCVMSVGVAHLLRGRSHFDGRALWPVVVLIGAVVCLEVYQRASFDRVYQTTHIQHRIFWHNVVIGFALNPVLAKEYALSVDDSPVIELVRRRLTETNRATEVDEIFRPKGSEEYPIYGIAKDYLRYERVAREIVASIIWQHKWEAVKTFIVDKPKVLFRQLVWAAGYGHYTTDELFLTGQAAALTTEQERHEKGIYLNVLNVWVLAALLVAVLLGGASNGGRARFAGYFELCALSGWMCALSLLPSLVAYPIISALGVSLVTVSFLSLSLLALLIAATERVLVRLTGAASARWSLSKPEKSSSYCAASNKAMKSGDGHEYTEMAS
jgi:hypothetical protein